MTDAPGILANELAARAAALVAEIRRIIVERPFLLNPGVSPEQIDAVHFEYEYETLGPVASPLNTQTGYCGGGEVLNIELDPTLRSKLHTGHAVDQDAVDDLIAGAYEKWFRTCWLESRGANPMIRGFLSVHDSVLRLELDSGETFQDGERGITFWV
jgi:hypothetical protein